MSDFDKMVGQKIALVRTTANMSQSALARELGITQQALSHYERGTTSISLSVFYKICSLLDAPMSWFVPNIKQYGDIVSNDDLELLREVKKVADVKTVLDFVRRISMSQNSGKKRRCLH